MPSQSTEAISNGVNTSLQNPTVFIPLVAPIVINLLFLLLAHLFPVIVGFYPYYYLGPNPFIDLGGRFLALIVGFLAYCMIVDMANDVIKGRTIDLKKSMDLVTSRLGMLIIAALIAAVCAITFVLLPVAFFIVTIAMLEGTDAIESTRKSFNFVINNLGEVIVFLIIVIVIAVIFGIGFSFIPIVGGFLGAVIGWILNGVFTVASVHFYRSLKPESIPPPPPPPATQ